MMRERLTALFLVSALLAGAFGMTRPAQPWVQGMQENLFWLKKMQWNSEFDLALAGDSRMFRGVSPEDLGRSLPGVRIANYGFSGCGFSRPYLDAIGGILDPRSEQRVIVLGVTPHSLTPNAARNNGYIDKKNLDPFSAWVYLTFPGISTYLKPYSSVEMRMLTGGPPLAKYYARYHASGWVASHKDPEDPREALEEYRRMFEGGNTVDPAQEDELASYVRKWRAQGIRVIGFRPPVSREMLELETRISGFDEARFINKFKTAGGVWLDIDQTGYHSYDGSHLEEKAARRFSRDLGADIAETLTRPAN
jgi:hypothetical protein